ncbi:alpha/beta fold hydrolase [Actinoplanes friuliensis]|uniref:Alpha/beta hydrolase fold protein n=1 Tax=Actinoplanes friuliensis DSM 7358 TaxID=1246995 RepID=U5VTJ7_9ACTN|nr:alpha/beta hydrolase [Actinoplanes friuliensis]AGZ39035.1 alpha/beta hydrolase fold protein [Actinoplanes friuliensis DSM 7358]
MATIDIPEGRVEYRAAGPDNSTAPPVVFVHGLLVNAELWTRVADTLADRGIRSYAPDLPLGGHRIALPESIDLSPQGIAQLIINFITALGLTDVTLVANDTGGALTQFIADADHSRIGRLVLTNCDAFDQFPPAPLGMLVKIGRDPGRLRALMTSAKLRFMRHSVLAFGGLARDPLDPELTRRWITPLLSDANVRRNAADFMRLIDPQALLDVSTRLHRFAKPVRVVWGDADRFFPVSLGRRLSAAFADATFVEIPTARTFIPLDEPVGLADEIQDVSRAAPRQAGAAHPEARPLSGGDTPAGSPHVPS